MTYRWSALRALPFGAFLLTVGAACSPLRAQPSPIVTSLSESPSLATVISQDTETPRPTAVEFEPFGTDITRSLPPGDAATGEFLFGPQGEFCSGCHTQLMIGPPMEGFEGGPPVAERAAEKMLDPDYSGWATTGVEYLVESIIDPNAYVVPGFPDGNMPDNYGLLLSTQDVADLVTYMLAVD